MRGLAYGRLSRDEDIELESLKNQEAIVVNAIKKGNNTVVDVAMDDNYTGMNFERPGIKKMFELARNGKIDAVFVNEDRHMHNVAVLMSQTGEFSYCPIFDNGAGLLSDTSMDYPLGTDLYDALSEVRAKTISGSFEEQMDVSEAVCGMNLHFSFTKKDVEQILNEIPGYSEQEKERVRDILFEQMRKYKYLFKN